MVCYSDTLCICHPVKYSNLRTCVETVLALNDEEEYKKAHPFRHIYNKFLFKWVLRLIDSCNKLDEDNIKLEKEVAASWRKAAAIINKELEKWD